MIRFRFTEDERRYQRLMAEAYRIIAANLPAHLVSQVMRNLGKLEQMASLEGVRQGLAIAELATLLEERGRLSGTRGLKAFQAHAVIYGSTDTPMRDVELEWLDKIQMPGRTAASAWLDESPLRYAPQTLDELDEEMDDSSSAPHFSDLDDLDQDLLPPSFQAVEETLDSVEASMDERDEFFQQVRDREEDACPATGKSCKWHRRTDGSWICEDCGDIIESRPDYEADERLDRQERPAMMDRIRGVLLKMNPKQASWQDMILHVHRVTGVDAGFLDIQLSSPMGMTVLAQCGIHINPGAGINLPELQERLAAAQPPPESDENDGSAP